MVQILVFVDSEPARVMKVRPYNGKIWHLYSDRVIRGLIVKKFFSTFLNGRAGVVLIAADRPVRREEILDAHDALIK
jgi:hypothetical protein